MSEERGANQKRQCSRFLTCLESSSLLVFRRHQRGGNGRLWRKACLRYPLAASPRSGWKAGPVAWVLWFGVGASTHGGLRKRTRPCRSGIRASHSAGTRTCLESSLLLVFRLHQRGGNGRLWRKACLRYPLSASPPFRVESRPRGLGFSLHRLGRTACIGVRIRRGTGPSPKVT